jgi:hypothetical protein
LKYKNEEQPSGIYIGEVFFAENAHGSDLAAPARLGHLEPCSVQQRQKNSNGAAHFWHFH